MLSWQGQRHTCPLKYVAWVRGEWYPPSDIPPEPYPAEVPEVPPEGPPFPEAPEEEPPAPNEVPPRSPPEFVEDTPVVQ